MRHVMAIFAVIRESLDNAFDLDERWRQIKFWLTQPDRKPQRLVAVAASLIFLSLVVLLITTCDGGPQIDP